MCARPLIFHPQVPELNRGGFLCEEMGTPLRVRRVRLLRPACRGCVVDSAGPCSPARTNARMRIPPRPKLHPHLLTHPSLSPPGLGKTVEVLSLILAAPPPASVTSGRPAGGVAGGKIESRATLVVRRPALGCALPGKPACFWHRNVPCAGAATGRASCMPRECRSLAGGGRAPARSRPLSQVCAVSLVGQWCAEASSKLVGSALRMHQYHGQNRCKDPAKLAKFDLVGASGERATRGPRRRQRGLVEWAQTLECDVGGRRDRSGGHAQLGRPLPFPPRARPPRTPPPPPGGDHLRDAQQRPQHVGDVRQDQVAPHRV